MLSNSSNEQNSARKEKEFYFFQKKTFPLITKMILFIYIVFFIASLVNLFYLYKRIEAYPRQDPEVNNIVKNLSPTASEYIYYHLELQTTERRYHQANILLISRIWIKNLGFYTGMILAFIGALFILGKIHDSEASEFKTEGSSLKFTLTSASPGLFLVAFGTLIMIVTIITKNEISIKDAPRTLQKSAQELPNIPDPWPIK